QCSLNVSARDLAVMGATLADGGVNPPTRERVVDASVCHFALAVMATAGLYETSGDRLYDIGLPGKSRIRGAGVYRSPGQRRAGAVSPAAGPGRQRATGAALRQFPVAAVGHGPVRLETRGWSKTGRHLAPARFQVDPATGPEPESSSCPHRPLLPPARKPKRA